MWQTNSKYSTHKNVSRFEMILFRMFISSDGLTSMSYRINFNNVNIEAPTDTQLHYVTTWLKGKNSWRNKESHSTHIPSELLEDSAKLFLFVALMLLCIYSRPAWRRLQERVKAYIQTRFIIQLWWWSDRAIYVMSVAHRIRGHKLGWINVAKKRKRINNKRRHEPINHHLWLKKGHLCRFSPHNIDEATNKWLEHLLSTVNAE